MNKIRKLANQKGSLDYNATPHNLLVNQLNVYPDWESPNV